MGKGKSSTFEYDFLSALTIEKGKYISLSVRPDDDSLTENEKSELLVVEAEVAKVFRSFSPEDIVIIKDTVDRLSPEAREVLEMIFMPTPEQLVMIGSKVQGRINKKRLSKYINRFYNVSVSRVLKEIEHVLRSMLELRRKIL